MFRNAIKNVSKVPRRFKSSYQAYKYQRAENEYLRSAFGGFTYVESGMVGGMMVGGTIGFAGSAYEGYANSDGFTDKISNTPANGFVGGFWGAGCGSIAGGIAGAAAKVVIFHPVEAAAVVTVGLFGAYQYNKHSHKKDAEKPNENTLVVNQSTNKR